MRCHYCSRRLFGHTTRFRRWRQYKPQRCVSIIFRYSTVQYTVPHIMLGMYHASRGRRAIFLVITGADCNETCLYTVSCCIYMVCRCASANVLEIAPTLTSLLSSCSSLSLMPFSPIPPLNCSPMINECPPPSSPRPPTTRTTNSPSQGFLIALPGSPLHRCVSYALFRFRRRRRRAKATPTIATPSPNGGDLEMTDQPLVRPDRWQAHKTTAAAAGREGRVGGTRKEILLTACCGSMLDFDHFLAAGSLRLSRATGLAERPWGHCVAAVVLAVSERGRTNERTILFFLFVFCMPWNC